jgi:hypothetical protein
VDLVAMTEDVGSHLGVPEAGLVAEMDTRLQHLAHGRHVYSPSRVEYRGFPDARTRHLAVHPVGMIPGRSFIALTAATNRTDRFAVAAQNRGDVLQQRFYNKPLPRLPSDSRPHLTIKKRSVKRLASL